MNLLVEKPVSATMENKEGVSASPFDLRASVASLRNDTRTLIATLYGEPEDHPAPDDSLLHFEKPKNYPAGEIWERVLDLIDHIDGQEVPSYVNRDESFRRFVRGRGLRHAYHEYLRPDKRIGARRKLVFRLANDLLHEVANGVNPLDPFEKDRRLSGTIMRNLETEDV